MKLPLCVLILSAQSLLGLEVPVVEEAQRAIAEGVPQVAIAKIEAALKNKSIGKNREAPLRVLAEAQLDSGRIDEALATLAQVPPSPQDALLRANVNLAAGNWAEALSQYKAILSQPNPPMTAALGMAESLQALGRTAEAVTTLRDLVLKGNAPTSVLLRLASLYVEAERPDDARKVLGQLQLTRPPDVKWRQLLEARIYLLENNPKAALATLEQFWTDKAGLSDNLVVAGALASADARLALSGPDVAQKELESFIRRNPESPQIDLVFRRLDQIYMLDRNPAEGVLHGFFKDLPPRASGFAQFYVTKMQMDKDRFERAQTSLTNFFKKFPQHELIPYAHQMQARMALRSGNLDAAEQAFDAAEQAYEAAPRRTKNPEFRAELALQAALVNLQQGKYARASDRLKEAKTSSRLKQSAAYNAALGWLMQQNYERFREELAAFAAQFQSPLLIGQLRLEEGLVRARNKETEAASVLQTFLRDFPEHPRKSEAQIALAELAFLRGGMHETAAHLARVKEAKDAKAKPETEEQADYLAVFLADKKEARDPEEVIRLARGFIHRFPASTFVADVRMKLGQVYFAGEDYLKAQEQFETLATSDPKGTFAEMALFLAGQCGMKLINTEALNHALELFDKVAERKGTLEMKARIQQAIIKNKLGAQDDAVKIYDNIISAQNGTDPQVRYAALVGKGDNLVAIAQSHADVDGAPSPLRERALNEAIQAYDQLLADPQAGAIWRNQTAYKKGKALQQLGHLDRALAVFYDVLDKTAAGDRESFWFAKAGFDAAALLEGREQWKNAVAVYEKMARVPGPHVAQAHQRVKTLRLERYLFD